ncbi:pyruvate kinase [Algoriphagus zhangzhouensis]|uniref:Pyruvate kinase n=1 Tax=Algoriphagus zhangzhouensis TaxID=1073327 RepID=A0A1M7Z7M0_9BACT|nr:pyruvate kinase [Algoriphagus zhangzhouensis]TDY49338.1 pyruvate kinase [Algoriphagus zhangzhouensis]SHO60792.1 pyruvate kinase [Algoriphagus zhangzhouensis]
MNQDLDEIREGLIKLESEMSHVDQVYKKLLKTIHLNHKSSAENFLKYLILRKTDIQHLQLLLHKNGLSSLASSESHIHRQIQVTLERLGQDFLENQKETIESGQSKIRNASAELFGKPQKGWSSSVMVTIDSGFLGERKLIRKLLEKGMGIARINCAHDDEKKWEKIIELIREESEQSGIPCKIHMDLAGPKIRTNLLKKGKEKGRVKVKTGDKIWLSDSGKGFSEKDIVISPNEKGVVQVLKIGDLVFIDDGLIEAKVEKLEDGNAQLLILRNSSKKDRLKAEKGINFPDTILSIPALTEFDRECLPFVVKHADTVGFSFVQRPTDLQLLKGEMEKISPNTPAIILKIETKDAVNHLPDLLLEGMKSPWFGVMIARGDLAVEIGFERLVEIQEEISWLCEAAHVPTIWATQVLENLHKSGVASRAEITDAGHAVMAECVMINKGDHTLEVLNSLKEIAIRTHSLKMKNRLIFRPLKIAGEFLNQLDQSLNH